MCILTEYAGGRVCGIFKSIEEANQWLEGADQSHLNDPAWFPDADSKPYMNDPYYTTKPSLVFLHRYEIEGGRWIPSHRLTEVLKKEETDKCQS